MAALNKAFSGQGCDTELKLAYSCEADPRKRQWCSRVAAAAKMVPHPCSYDVFALAGTPTQSQVPCASPSFCVSRQSYPALQLPSLLGRRSNKDIVTLAEGTGQCQEHSTTPAACLQRQQRIDVLIGGFSCKDFSRMNSHKAKPTEVVRATVRCRRAQQREESERERDGLLEIELFQTPFQPFLEHFGREASLR